MRDVHFEISHLIDILESHLEKYRVEGTRIVQKIAVGLKGMNQ